MEHYKKYISNSHFPNLTKTALLIIDAQAGFLREMFAIAEPLNALADAYRHKGTPIIWLQHIQNRNQTNGKSRDISNHPSLTKGRDEIEFSHLIDAYEGETIFIKPTYDAFYKTDLHQYLIQMDIKELVITGPMTNCSCDSTARTAYTLGYKIHVVSDATVAYDDYIQDATLSTLAKSFAYIFLMIRRPPRSTHPH